MTLELKKAMRIVLTDDDPHALLFLQKSFQHFGVFSEIIYLKSGEELLDFMEHRDPLQQQKIDCLLLDMKMPGKSGRETLEALRANHWAEETPVVVMSHGSYAPDIEAVMKLGACAFWQKPGSLEEYRSFVEKINSLLDPFSFSKN